MGILSCTCYPKRLGFSGSFSGLFVVVFVFVLFLASKRTDSIHNHSVYGRKILQSIINDDQPISDTKNSIGDPINCPGIYIHEGYNSTCDYLRANPDCNSGGLFNYLVLFYCHCSKNKALGYIVLGILLVCSFYLLGSTASDYFCCCLEKLSTLLKLPPTVSGVTLLALGNGAPDVFSGIAAFIGQNSGDVGFNSVLGGALFVTCIVVGAVSFCVADKNLQIDHKCFIRDVIFFLVVLFSLCIILAFGEVSIGGAIAFVSIYIVYVLCVAAKELLRKHRGLNLCSFVHVLSVKRQRIDEDNIESVPLIQPESEEEQVPVLEDKLPHWIWSTNVAIYSLESVPEPEGDSPRPICFRCCNWCSSFSCSKLHSILELPLVIPRRLTIPIVDEARWSKGYAVASVFLSPILLAFLWSTTQENATPFAYTIACCIGIILGLLALLYTRSDHPPQRLLSAWVSAGFLMSIVWFYIIANELVALLVTIGIIMKLKASLLAFTILAWGNSLGDLVSNTAIAKNNENGVQIAMSGCYAGPMFNTLIGLGVSLLLRTWSDKPNSYVIPIDDNLYLSLGFLMLSLVWSLVVLPRNGMRPGRLLGSGLVIIYLTFLALGATFAI